MFLSIIMTTLAIQMTHVLLKKKKKKKRKKKIKIK